MTPVYPGRSVALAGLTLMCAACTQKSTDNHQHPKKSPASAPSSQATSLPTHHRTSTTAVHLNTLFAPPSSLPEVVATVNGTPMTKPAYVHQLRQLQVQFQAAGLPQEYTREDILVGALNMVVDTMLLEQLAAELKVAAAPEAIDGWLKDLEKRMEKDKAFKAFLLQAGKNEEQRRRDARQAVLYEAVFKALSDDVADALTEDAKKYYERHPQDYTEFAGIQLWRIFIRAPKTMNQRDRNIAHDRTKELYNKAVAAPENFLNLAKSFSEGGKASTGGYLGYVAKGSVEHLVYQQAEKAKPGDILPLWDSAAGFAIYKVGERRKQRKIPFEEVRGSIIQHLYSNNIRKKVDDQIQSLRTKAEVTIHAKPVAQAKTILTQRASP